EYYALEGLAQLVRSVELIRARLNPRLAIAGVILTMVDRRTRLAADVDAEVRRHFGDLVFRASVPRSVRIAEAPSHGLPVTAHDRRLRADRGRAPLACREAGRCADDSRTDPRDRRSRHALARDRRERGAGAAVDGRGGPRVRTADRRVRPCSRRDRRAGRSLQ